MKIHPLLAFALLGTAVAAGAEDVKLNWQSSDATKTWGYYMPTRTKLSPEKPDGLRRVPADLAAPLYGMIQLGPSDSVTTFYVVVDEPEGKPARLFVDANANGDATDDPAVEWKGKPYKSRDGAALTRYTGSADLQVNYGAQKLALRVNLYRFDKHDPQRASTADMLVYYGDFARVGDVSVEGKNYHAMLVDSDNGGDFRPPRDTNQTPAMLLLDLNNNGKFEGSESFNVTKPFKIGETTYEVAGLTASGDDFQIVKSLKTVEVPEVPKPRVTLAAGSNAPAFEAKALDGTQVHFPTGYKGKLVMVDFWATWCGPCRGEIPGLSRAYTKYHDKGFEVVGVSLDQPNANEKLTQFTKDNAMPWPEVYDGADAVAQEYSIHSIPNPYLVDGDTGKIVAMGGQLRGDSLDGTIEKALAKHP